MKYLITGGCGFLGSNLASDILKDHHSVVIVDNFYRHGSQQNYEWLLGQGEFSFYNIDISDSDAVEKVISKELPDVVFHVAGQVAMTTSISNPRKDFQINVLGTLNILEAIRNYRSDAIVVFSSTNKVYGDLLDFEYLEKETRYVMPQYSEGLDESICLNFQSPYGCSKGAADQYILDYYRTFGIRTVVFRHSSIYGGRQFATYDQGWVGWFCQKVIETKMGILDKPFTISGNGKQVRDLLHIDDAINVYKKAVLKIDDVAGNAFNIGGGFSNSLSIIELINFLSDLLDCKLSFENIKPRQSDQLVFIANHAKATKELEWIPKTTYHKGIVQMIDWISNYQHK